MGKATVKTRAPKQGQVIQYLDGEWVTRSIDQLLEDYPFPGGGEGGITDGDKGDITVVSSPLTFTIDNDVVTNAKMANMAADTIKGRANGAGTGDPTDLTAAQVRTIINVANGATANSSDATLLDRANHTGSQAISTITNLQDELDGKQAAGSYATALGADDNYVTDAEKVKLSNLSGTNSGDETDVGIKTKLGVTTVGSFLYSLANPSAIRFLRINADNTVTARTAAEMLSDIGGQASLVSATNIKTVNGSSLLGSGDLVVTGSQPDIPLTKISPSSNQTITAGYGAYVPFMYELVNSISLEIGAGSYLEIG